MELDMTRGNPLQLIIKFAIPLIIGNLFQQLYNMVDTIIVGQSVGVKALAAVGATGNIMFLIIGFMQGLTTGFTVLTAQRFGAGDKEGLQRSIGTASMLSVVFTIIFTILSVYFMEDLLHLMNTPEDIFEMSYTYITIICAGLAANVLYNLLASMLRSVGNSVIPLVFLIISALLNIGLDLLFIINFQMGVAGAAWATVVAQGISGIACLIYIIKKVPVMHIEKYHWTIHWGCAKNQIGLGVPMALQFSITAIGTIMIQSSLNILGSTVIAAYTAAAKAEQLVEQPFLALGMTMATYGGQNIGVNDIDRIKKGVRIGCILTVVYGVIIAIVVISGIEYILRLFVSGDISEILGYGRTYIIICASFFIPLGLIFIFRNILQGMGFAFMPMMAGVMELIGRGAVALIASKYLSFAGICAANPVAWVMADILLVPAYIMIIKKLTERKRILSCEQ